MPKFTDAIADNYKDNHFNPDFASDIIAFFICSPEYY